MTCRRGIKLTTLIIKDDLYTIYFHTYISNSHITVRSRRIMCLNDHHEQISYDSEVYSMYAIYSLTAYVDGNNLTNKFFLLFLVKISVLLLLRCTVIA